MERRNAIRSDIDLLAARERESRSNLQELHDLRQTQSQLHRNHLNNALNMVDQRTKGRFNNWRVDRHDRKGLTRQCLRGKPETIPDTWAALAY